MQMVPEAAKRTSNDSGRLSSDENILNLIQQRGVPKLYCYPRVRVHSSLGACCIAAYRSGPQCPLSLRSALMAAVSPLLSLVQGREMNMLQRMVQAAPTEEHVIKQISPSCGVPLVSGSTVSMVDAVLRHLCMVKGTVVFVPGLLFFPYYNLLELFDCWGLQIVAYDVNFVKMEVDIRDLRRKIRSAKLARSHRLTSGSYGVNKDSNKTGSTHSSPPLFLFVGVDGRRIANIEDITRLVRTEFHAFTIELGPLTAAQFYDEKIQGRSARADVCIISMDGAGQLGGAIAVAADPLLSAGIFQQLEGRPAASVREHWMTLARHVAHLLISDCKSFRLVLYILHLCSLLRSRDDGVSTQNSHGEWVYRLLFSNQAQSPLSGIRTCAVSEEESKKNGGKPTVTVRPVSNSCLSFSRPHPGVVAWLAEAITRAQRSLVVECFSFWDFVSRLRKDVEVVSAGEPQAPEECVPCYSNSVLMRVRTPVLAAQALCSVGFDAAPITPRWWGGRHGEKIPYDKVFERDTLRRLSIHDSVVFGGCPMCEELAQHSVCVPLYPAMRQTNREKLQSAVQSMYPPSLFRSPSDEFHRHVAASPAPHAYQSAAVNNLILQCKRCISGCGATAAFTDAQPLLLRCLFGPIPSYIVSKL